MARRIGDLDHVCARHLHRVVLVVEQDLRGIGGVLGQKQLAARPRENRLVRGVHQAWPDLLVGRLRRVARVRLGRKLPRQPPEIDAPPRALLQAVEDDVRRRQERREHRQRDVEKAHQGVEDLLDGSEDRADPGDELGEVERCPH